MTWLAAVANFIDALNAFMQKLEKWTRKTQKRYFAMFEALSTLTSDDMDDALTSEILVHFTSLRKEFLRYFPKILESDLKLVRKPFAVPVEVRDDLQDEFTDLKNDSTCRGKFNTLSICEYWAKMCSSYPDTAKECITKLLPFSSTYLCQSGFSTLMQMENKTRNRLDVENGLRCALSSTHPRIEKLVHCV